MRKVKFYTSYQVWKLVNANLIAVVSIVVLQNSVEVVEEILPVVAFNFWGYVVFFVFCLIFQQMNLRNNNHNERINLI